MAFWDSIGKAARGAYYQINPFDRGLTYSDSFRSGEERKRKQQQQAPRPQQPQNTQYVNGLASGGGVKAQEDRRREVARQAARQQVQNPIGGFLAGVLNKGKSVAEDYVDLNKKGLDLLKDPQKILDGGEIVRKAIVNATPPVQLYNRVRTAQRVQQGRQQVSKYEQDVNNQVKEAFGGQVTNLNDAIKTLSARRSELNPNEKKALLTLLNVNRQIAEDRRTIEEGNLQNVDPVGILEDALVFGGEPVADMARELSARGGARIVKELDSNKLGKAMVPFIGETSKGIDIAQESSLGKFIFGRGKVDKASDDIKSFTKDIPVLRDIFKYAPLATAGGIAINLPGIGGTKAGKFAKASKELSLVDNVDDVVKVIGKYDDLAQTFGAVDDTLKPILLERLAKETKPKEIQKSIRGSLEATKRLQLADPNVDPLEALKAEARKYKSAEEFVNSKINAYRATSETYNPLKVSLGGNKKQFGTYVTNDLETAKAYLDNRNTIIDNLHLTDKAKVATESDLPKKFRINELSDYKKFGGPQEWQQKAAKWAKDNGYDVMDFGGRNNMTVVNPEALKTKQQLTDLYNQAKTVAPVESKGVDNTLDELQNLQPEEIAKIDDLAKQAGFKGLDDVAKSLQPKAVSNISEAVPKPAIGSVDQVDPKLVQESKVGSVGTYKNTQEEAFVAQLPKTVRTKIERGQPLTNPDRVKIEAVRTRINKKLGISPEQQALGLGVSTPETIVRNFARGMATKKTDAGNILPLAKGTMGVTKQAKKSLLQLAEQGPSQVGKAFILSTRRGPKEFRTLETVIGSIAKKNPNTGKFLRDFVQRPMTEFRAYANNFVNGSRKQLVDSRKANKLSRGDKPVLKELLEGNTKALQDAKNPEAVKQVAADFRAVYDDVLTQLNSMELLTGAKLTPKRADYFTHIEELLQTDKFVRAALTEDPAYINRLGSAFRFSKQRTGSGAVIEEDPYKVMDLYLDASKARLATMVPSRNLNLTMDILDSGGLANRAGQKELRQWFKAINDSLTGSVPATTLIERGQGRIAKGVVAGNPASTLMNFIQGFNRAGTAPIHSIKGLYSGFLSTVRALSTGSMAETTKVGGFQSAYLVNALDATNLQKVATKNPLEIGGDIASRIFLSTDYPTRKFLVETEYSKALSSGLEGQEALRVAEQNAEFLLPSRIAGSLPPAFQQGTVLRMLNFFQTEVQAQAEFTADLFKPAGRNASKTGKATIGSTAKVPFQLAGLALAGHIFNEGFESVFPGRRPAIDPIQWYRDSFETSEADQIAIDQGLESPDTTLENTTEFLRKGLGQVPFVGSWLSGEMGARSPFPGLEIAKQMTVDTDPNKEGAIEAIVKGIKNDDLGKETLIKAGRNWSAVLGRGTKPLFRAVEGGIEYFRDDDSRGFDTKKNKPNLIRSILGGAYNTSEAQEMFKNSDNRKKIIEAASEKTRTEYDTITKSITKDKNGKLVKVKGTADQETTFSLLRDNPELRNLFNATAQFDAKQGKPVDPIFDPKFYKDAGLDIKDAQHQQAIFSYLFNRAVNEPRAKATAQTILSKEQVELLDDRREKFFDEIAKLPKGSKDIPELFNGPGIPKPDPSDAVKSKVGAYFEMPTKNTKDYQAKEQYLKDNPEIGEYLSQIAEYKRARNEYLAQPSEDEYPKATKEVERQEDEYFKLPENDGPKGGNKTRSLYLKSHPELVKFWIRKNIWTLQDEAAVSLYEGVDLSQKALEKIKSLANNIKETDDGNFILTTESQFGSNGGKGGKGGGKTAKDKRVPLSSLTSYIRGLGTDIPDVASQIRAPEVRLNLPRPVASRAKRVKIKFR